MNILTEVTDKIKTSNILIGDNRLQHTGRGDVNEQNARLLLNQLPADWVWVEANAITDAFCTQHDFFIVAEPNRPVLIDNQFDWLRIIDVAGLTYDAISGHYFRTCYGCETMDSFCTCQGVLS